MPKGVVVALAITAPLVVSVAALVATVHVCSDFGIEFFFSHGIRVVRMNDPMGPLSPSGKYRLVEMQDATGQFITYAVIAEGEPPKTVYAADDEWYFTRFSTEASWANNTDDFFVVSSDSGVNMYRYENGSWFTDGFLMSKDDREGAQFEGAYAVGRNVDFVTTYEPYDEANIPPLVTRYWAHIGKG